MLEEIKHCISNRPECSFDEYFQDYICSVQDANILMEVDVSRLFNNLNISTLPKEIESYYKELLKSC